jgi:hypothetical protein
MIHLFFLLAHTFNKILSFHKSQKFIIIVIVIFYSQLLHVMQKLVNRIHIKNFLKENGLVVLQELMTIICIN